MEFEEVLMRKAQTISYCRFLSRKSTPSKMGLWLSVFTVLWSQLYFAW